MRNASTVGAQALSPIDFPYFVMPHCRWSKFHPDYTERMRVISEVTNFEFEVMVDYDKADKDGTQ